MPNSALKSLHTGILDALKGYKAAVDRSDKAAVTALFKEMVTLHEGAHRYVHQALVGQGEKADDEGSFMGTMNKAVVTARSAITGLEEGSLSSFASGEEHVIREYDEAIKESAYHSLLVEELTRQKSALIAKVEEMKRIAASA